MKLNDIKFWPNHRIEEEIRLPIIKVMAKAEARMKLGGRDRHIKGVEDTDLKHTITSLNYAIDLAEGEGLDLKEKKILYTAMCIHDCAYGVAASFAEFTSFVMRTLHMHDSVHEFDKWDMDGFTSEEKRRVSHIVGQHDNPSIKCPYTGKRLKFYGADMKLIHIHRTADRCWMLHPAGFDLDMMRLDQEGGFAKEEYLLWRITKEWKREKVIDYCYTGKKIATKLFKQLEERVNGKTTR